MKRFVPWSALVFLTLCATAPAFGQAPSADQVKELQASLDKANDAIAALQTSTKVNADTVWVMITAFLVFFMNLGFACVESGFCRAKNAVNILSKNFVVFAATTIGFWFIGWGLMFGNGSPWYGKDGMLMVEGADNSPATTIPGFAGQLKADVKETLGIDLDDKKDADANPQVASAVEGYVQKFDSTTFNTVEKKNEKGEVEKANVTVDVTIAAGGKTLEKNYKTADYYWGAYSSIAWSGVPLWAKFFFQLVFAGTAATIVSGAVAERIKYHSFILFSFVMAIVIYPIVGHWVWGGGVLQSRGFLDFAGSTQVHSVGGWAALAGIIILGPRIGKFGPDGKINAIPGHNLTAATIGCFVLWFGWFGFNPGSTMAASGADIAEIALTTNLAACAATLTATITAWLLLGKPDLGMTLNGCLAGLVAITAGCAFFTAGVSLMIGAVAGVVVVLAVLMFDRLRIDDPVGATSVHLVNGVLGTIAVGLFATPDRLARAGNPAATAGLFYGGGTSQLITQLIGVAYCAVYVFAIALIAWIVLKVTVGIRVSAEEEMEGLDIGEHGNEAYYGFAMNRELLTGGADPKAAVTPTGGKRFAVVVDTVSNGELLHAWSEMCQPGKATDPKLFKEVYGNMTTVQGNRFVFRGGDPERMKQGLQTLLQGKVKGKLNVHVI